MYGTVLIVKNIVLNTLKIAKGLDLVLCYQKITIMVNKKRKETSGGDGYVYGSDCGDGFTDVYICANASSCIH